MKAVDTPLVAVHRRKEVVHHRKEVVCLSKEAARTTMTMVATPPSASMANPIACSFERLGGMTGEAYTTRKTSIGPELPPTRL
jgi:hypothetical protein